MVFNIAFANVQNNNTAFYIDLQRNYGRTIINGEVLPAELVALFYIAGKH